MKNKGGSGMHFLLCGNIAVWVTNASQNKKWHRCLLSLSNHLICPKSLELRRKYLSKAITKDNQYPPPPTPTPRNDPRQE